MTKGDYSYKNSHTPISENQEAQANQSQKVKVKVKKYTKILTLWCKILQKLHQHLYPAQIARQLDIKKQNVDYHVKNMEAEGLIYQEIKSNITSWKLTESGLRFMQEKRQSQKVSLGVSDAHTVNIRTHNLKLKLRILSDNPSANLTRELEYRAIQKKNWTSEIFLLTYPIGMTVEKTTQSVIINYHEFDCKPESYTRDFVIAMNKGMLFLYDYLARKYQIKVDIFAPEILDDHMANPHPELDGSFDKRASTEIGLGHKASAIYPSKQDGKAWVDFSPGHVEIETNDLPFQQAFLQMPMTVQHLRNDVIALNNQVVPIVNQFAEQIAIHLPAVQGLKTGVEQYNANIAHLVGVVDTLAQEVSKIKQSTRETVTKLPTVSVSPHAQSVTKLHSDADKKGKRYLTTTKKQQIGVTKLKHAGGRPRAQIDSAELARIKEMHPNYGLRRLARRMHVSYRTLDRAMKRAQTTTPKVEAPRAQSQSDLEKLVFHQPR